MIGLRVEIPGRAPVTMALNLSDYLVSASAHWRWRAIERTPRLKFSGTGLDDRDDHLVWFVAEPAAPSSSMVITPVDTATADPPRRRPRPRVDWDARFRRHRRDDIRAIARFTRLLRQPERPPPALPDLPDRADGGFVVSIDGRAAGSAGIGGRGTVNVTVFAKQKGPRVAINLCATGGEFLGEMTYRWRRWSWGNVQLDFGQRVCIEVGRPEQLDLGYVSGIDQLSYRTKAQMREELADLRKEVKSDGHAKEARDMKAYDRNRPPPRTYPRSPIRAD